MAGYIRQRDANIAPGELVRAEDHKAELDTIQGAFNSATGHTHGGGTGEGAPIILTGPAQDYNFSGSAFYPKTTDDYDLGTTLLKFKSAYFTNTVSTLALVASGNVTIGGNLTVTGTFGLTGNVDINGGTIDGTSIGSSSASTGAFTTLTSSSTTTLNGTTIPASKTLVTLDDVQTLTNKSLTSPTLTGTPTAPTATADTNTTQIATTAFVEARNVAERTKTATITGKTIDLTNNTLIATSAQLRAALTDETGTGSAVFNTSPTLTSPIITSGTLSDPVITGGTLNGGDALTVTSTELNILDGITGIASEAEAIAGTVTNKLMTPYLVKKAQERQIPPTIGAYQAAAGDLPTSNTLLFSTNTAIAISSTVFWGGNFGFDVINQPALSSQQTTVELRLFNVTAGTITTAQGLSNSFFNGFSSGPVTIGWALSYASYATTSSLIVGDTYRVDVYGYKSNAGATVGRNEVRVVGYFL